SVRAHGGLSLDVRKRQLPPGRLRVSRACYVAVDAGSASTLVRRLGDAPLTCLLDLAAPQPHKQREKQQLTAPRVPRDVTQESFLCLSPSPSSQAVAMEMQLVSGGGGANGSVDTRSLAAEIQRSQAAKKQRYDEEEMLRRSLRESERLRRLKRGAAAAAAGSVIGEENVGFEPGDDSGNSATASAVPASAEVAQPPVSAEEVRDLLQQLRDEGVDFGEDSGDGACLAALADSPRFDAVLRLAALAARGRSASACGPAGPDAVGVAAAADAEAAGVVGASPSRQTAQWAAEFRRLLSGPHLRALLQAHDLAAAALRPPAASATKNQKKSRQAAPPPPSQPPSQPHQQPQAPRAASPETPQPQFNCFDEVIVEDGVQFKRVVLFKDGDRPLGATIKNEGDSVVISRVVCGGICQQTGLLREGDELLTANDIELRGKNVNEVYEILQRMSGQLTFFVLPAADYRPPTQAAAEGLTLRALFSYSPHEDFYNPCKELGLEFTIGDIIHVASRDDPNWWQGRREGHSEDDGLARIFPSPEFQRQRECISICLQPQEEDEPSGCCPGLSGYSPAKLEAPQRRPFYERQARLLPQPLRRRPLVLVGPPGVGRHELRVRLVESDPSRFAPAVPHTTRAANPEEVDGSDYWFVSKAEFQRLRSEGAFIETGQFNGDSYGTCVASIQKVVDEGKVCVLTLQPESLEALRSHPARLMPFAVFVSQPSTDRLRALRRKLAVSSQHTPDPSDDELRGIVELGRSMEESHGHLFDFALVHTDLAAAHNQLLGQVSRLEREPQWVPASWLLAEPGAAEDFDTAF
uniref:PDZ domain-containing protein n=2 Tax=Macrostomum lignano TaxID=282301 RepID=A0A1I8IHH2_9PLAT